MSAQKPAVFPLDISTLISTGRFADRFSYCSYFVPVSVTFEDDAETPILTFPQREWITQIGSLLPDEVMDRWLEDLGLSQLKNRNGLEIREQAVSTAPPAAGGRANHGLDSLHEAVGELRAVSHIITDSLPAENEVSLLLSGAVRRVESESAATATATAAATAAPLSDLGAVAPVRRQQLGATRSNGSVGATSSDELKNLLRLLVQPEIGYLFLDRTRIRPKGFGVGEHIYSLSLAPAEEVTLEQKSYTKRTVTMEEVDEREQSMDIELASTLTSELNESMDRTTSLTDKWGLNASHTGAYSTPEFFWGSIDADHTIGTTKDVTEANTETSRRSVKDSHSISSKIASKYRSLHKVSFSVKTETGFESTSKRLIRNQSRFTPVDYHFFKMLRVVELSHERYGVMLCWAPFVRRPAAQFFARLKTGRSEIIGRAESDIPAEPQPPLKVADAGKTRRVWSSQIEADRWGTLGEMSAIYTLSIPILQGWEWPGDDAAIKDVQQSVRVNTLYVSKTPQVAVVGAPWLEQTQLKVMVSVNLQNAWDRGDVNKPSKIYLSAGAILTQVSSSDPVDTAAYAAAYADYVKQHQAWVEDANKRRAEAAEAADAWEAAMLEESNPVNELVNRLITENFSPDIRDSGPEIELWQRIFQWEAASYELYPGWWADEPMRDPLGGPNDFFNASWGRLFLPVRPGMETTALKWIFSKTTHRPLRSGVSGAISTLVNGLTDHRDAHYPTERVSRGSPCPDVEAKFTCLGRWEETLPTDGTHIEVTQSPSLSIDSFAQQDLEDTAELRKAVLESRKQDVEIKRHAARHITDATEVEVKIHTDAGADGSGA